MPPIWVLLNHITSELKIVSDNPRFEAELLLANALNMTRAELISRVKEEINIPTQIPLWIERRKKHEPIAYILGYTEFFGLNIITTPPIFIPRPETELLVEETLKIIEQSTKETINILELCTGTGCVAISICKNLKKKIKCIVTDINKKAILLAKQNAKKNSVNFDAIICDLFSAINDRIKFDIIVANPPYISEKCRDSLPPTVKNYEDPQALFCEGEGTAVIKKIIKDAKNYLTEGGWLLLEIGEEQSEFVEKIFYKNEYDNINTILDLQKLPRIVKGNWNHKK